MSKGCAMITYGNEYIRVNLCDNDGFWTESYAHHYPNSTEEELREDAEGLLETYVFYYDKVFLEKEVV